MHDDFCTGSGWPHPRQHYIARWQGLLRIMESGPYKFLLQCDTEARMYFGLPPDQSLVMQNNGSATQLVGLYYESEIHMVSVYVAGTPTAYVYFFVT